MTNKKLKLENPARIAELKPVETLKKIGLKEDSVVCDIGAGTGIFTIPAASITKKMVYALDIDDEMLSTIEQKSKDKTIKNIELIKVNGNQFEVKDKIADIILLVTVFHEIENKEVFLGELKRILNNLGKIAVIEFHKRATPMGPPVDHRIANEEVKRLFTKYGFSVNQDFDLGENFYCSVFTN